MSVITRRRRSGKVAYYVCVKWRGRTVWEPAGHDKRYARSLNRQRLQEVRDGIYQPRTTLNPTVGEYCREWIGKRTVRSRSDEERSLEKAVLSREWLAGMRLGDVRGAHIRRLIDELEATTKEDGNPLSPKYVANIYGVVSQVFATAERYELIVRSPCRSIERKRLQRKSKKRRSIYALDAIAKLLTDERISTAPDGFASSRDAARRELRPAGDALRGWRTRRARGCLPSSLGRAYSIPPFEVGNRGGFRL